MIPLKEGEDATNEVRSYLEIQRQHTVGKSLLRTQERIWEHSDLCQ